MNQLILSFLVRRDKCIYLSFFNPRMLIKLKAYNKHTINSHARYGNANLIYSYKKFSYLKIRALLCLILKIRENLFASPKKTAPARVYAM